MTMSSTPIPRERLDARIGWQEALADQLVIEGDRLHLASTTRNPAGDLVFAQPIPDTDPAGSFGGRTLPRGVAISDQGDVYLADPHHGRILYTNASLAPVPPDPNDPAAPFVSLIQFDRRPEPGHPLALSAPVDLVLVPGSADAGQFVDALVIADGSRLVWLDRHKGITRHVLALEGRVIDIAVDHSGNIHALVEAADEETAQLLTIRRGTVVRILAFERRPHSLAVLADGTVLLADFEHLWALDADGREIDAAAKLKDTQLTPPALIKDGDTLLFAQSCAAAEPLRLDGIKTDRFGALGGTGLALVTLPRNLPRPRAGTWVAGPFDGEQRAFPWHMIGLDLNIPPQCRVTVSTFTVDHPMDAAQVQVLADWQGRAVIEPNDPAEALIQHNKGRYLWLRIEAFGNGTQTPAITGIDIFGPRNSQLNLLPAPFHEDPQSADFLDRLLSLQDAFLAEALAIFESVGAILRPSATPRDYLDWLGGWFDWQFLAEWDDATRREMIAASIRFFDERGTICGIERMLRWHTGLSGALPLVLEGYRTQRAMELLTPQGDPREVWIAGDRLDATDLSTHHFTIILPQDAAPDAAARAQIDRIINAQKPAHTTHSLTLVRPGLVPGQQATLGVDAILPDTKPPPLGAGGLTTELQLVDPC